MRTTKYPGGASIDKGPIPHGDPGWTADLSYYSCPPNAANNGEDCNAAYPSGADATPAGGTVGTGEKYGLLYQWSAAVNGAGEGAQGICPSGWHIPTDADWKFLEGTVDSTYGVGHSEWDGTNWRGDDAGTKLKSGGSSGFEGLLAGYRNPNGSYYSRGTNAILWSSTPSGGDAWRRYLAVSNADVNRNALNKANGFSVRCLKD